MGKECGSGRKLYLRVKKKVKKFMSRHHSTGRDLADSYQRMGCTNGSDQRTQSPQSSGKVKGNAQKSIASVDE